ncbi:hypothetical protein [Streptomyces sp. KLOTTS4A1]|uniref:hypothetical protein n=1 Tax=Streptomyces sp. KLOTTS4A1 TaxID=3390996 RepID=UPI0039F5049D
MWTWPTKHARLLWSLACAGLVLILVGFAVRAPVKDWWLARQACDGALPGEDLETVRTEARLGSYEESFDEETGAYRCVLRNDADKVVIAVEAFPPGYSRDEELSSIGRSHAPHAVLPGGLPGFEAPNSQVYLLPECADGVEDPGGQDTRLLVGTWTYFAESRAEKAAMLRLAVRMTNHVTEKLGCGSEPLPLPEPEAVPDTGRFVARTETKNTPCAAFATTRVPEEGRDGEVRIAVADGGIVGRCTLHAPSGEDSKRSDGRGQALVELTSWRGNWGTELREMGSGPDPLPMGPGAWKPALTGSRAWAVAMCDGQKAGFAAHWGLDSGLGLKYRKNGKYAPPGEEEVRESSARLRAYVTAFAEEQVRREGCTDLQLPSAP